MFPEDIEEIEDWPMLLGDENWLQSDEEDPLVLLISPPVQAGVIGFLLGACCAGVLLLARRGCGSR